MGIYYMEKSLKVKSELNRTYSICQETETSRIELWDETSWLILVDVFKSESEMNEKLNESICKYEHEEIGKKYMEAIKNWSFNYKDGLVSMDDETCIYNGKQARIVADFWGDMNIRKTVKDSTMYIEHDGDNYILRNDKDIVNCLHGHFNRLRKAKNVFCY